MKKFGKLLYFIVPLLIGIVFANGLNMYLDHEISTMMKQKDLMPIRNAFGSNIKSKGVIANDYFLNQKDIMFLGSSELRHVTLQHPSYYFNTNRSRNQAFIVGQEYDQDLQAATIIGSLNPNIKDKKVVFTFSFQWFLLGTGMVNYDFGLRFSPTQFYAFLDNPKISKETKVHFEREIYRFLKGSNQYAPEVLYAKIHGYNGITDKVERVLLYPYFVGRKFMVNLKEKGLLYLRLKGLAPYVKPQQPMKPVDWNLMWKQAYKDGTELSQNKYGMLNSEYTPEFREKLIKFRDSFWYSNLIKSYELNQFKLFLQVCKETGVKPTIVVMPGMNWFYNWIGVSKKDRDTLFNEVDKLCNQYGFKVIDLRQYDQTKYFLRDVAHLGSLGWTNVSEQIYRQYNENNPEGDFPLKNGQVPPGNVEPSNAQLHEWVYGKPLEDNSAGHIEMTGKK